MDLRTRELMERASRGDAIAQRELASALYYGRGCERCVTQALGWLLLASRRDDGARHLLAQLERRGLTIPDFGM